MGCEAWDYKDILRESKAHVFFFKEAHMNNRMGLRLKADAALHDLATEDFPFSLQTFVERLGVINMVGHFVYYENFCYLLVLQQPKNNGIHFSILTPFQNSETLAVS